MRYLEIDTSAETASRNDHIFDSKTLQDRGRHVAKSAPNSGGIHHLQIYGANQTEVKAKPLQLNEAMVDALSLFGQLDIEHEGKLSRQDLAMAVQNPQFKDKDAAAIASLYIAGGDFTMDYYGSGLSKTDVEMMSQIANRDQAAAIARGAQWILGHWAPSASGMTKESVLASVQTGTDAEKADVNSFLAHYAHGFSLYDLPQAANIVDAYDEASLVLQRASAVSDKPSSRLLYGDASHTLSSICEDAIAQGMIGNCYLEAPLAGVANQEPEFIKKSITDNKNGTYTVRFQGAPTEAYTVKAPTDAELDLFNGASKYGVWPSIIEEAYGIYHARHFGQREAATAASQADGGGDPDTVLRLLTNHDTEQTNIQQAFGDGTYDDMKVKLHDKLTAAFTAQPRLAVIASTPSSIPVDMQNQLVESHAYTITGFEPNGPDGGTIIVRNPWGKGSDSRDGLQRISFDRFVTTFDKISIETKNQLTAQDRLKLGVS